MSTANDLLMNYVEILLQNIMILGDFNADGRYLSQRRRENVSIASSSYTWLIADDVDTTTSNSNSHTYDRYSKHVSPPQKGGHWNFNDPTFSLLNLSWS